MSAYNGDKYLAEQLDSILAQEGVHAELFIRDDGSKDGTRNILEDYARQHANIHVSLGENLGPGMSFITEPCILADSGKKYSKRIIQARNFRMMM